MTTLMCADCSIRRKLKILIRINPHLALADSVRDCLARRINQGDQADKNEVLSGEVDFARVVLVVILNDEIRNDN